MDDRQELLDRYRERHGRYVDGSATGKAEWFRRHAPVYIPHLPPPEAAPEILELACGPGFLLADLQQRGYNRLTGVDLSTADVTAARDRLPGARIVQEDVADFLGHDARYDVVIAKALFEHIPKKQVIPLTRSVAAVLNPGGVALVEVPNMDWHMATHERFMDFTHEVGYTRESLAQVLRSAFDDVTVVPVPATSLHGRVYRVARAILWPPMRAAINGILALAGGDGQKTLWEHRSILGVAKAPRG